MEIPKRYLTIIDDFVERAKTYTGRGHVPPPTLIKGGPYTGTNLLMHEIHRRLIGKDKDVHLKFLRFRLSDIELSDNINRELAIAGKPSKIPTIFFMDGIDRVLNLPTRIINRENTKGRTAKIQDIIKEAHKVRKVLIENSKKVSLVSTSSLNPKFMKNPELPFYKFFNEITVNQLSSDEAVQYFFSLMKRNSTVNLKMDFFAELGEASYEWPYKITGGNWALILHLYQVLAANEKLKGHLQARNGFHPLKEFL